jgi:hypothetical protein
MTANEIVSALDRMESREQGREFLLIHAPKAKDLAELRKLLSLRNGNKDDLRERIIQQTIGFRLDHDVIARLARKCGEKS